MTTMFEAASLTEERAQPSVAESSNKSGKNPGWGAHALQVSSQVPNDSLDVEGGPSVSENNESPSTHSPGVALNKEGQPAEPPKEKDENPNETIEHLVALFRELLEAAPNSKATDRIIKTPASRKKLFGLTKGLSPDTNSNNPFDYEQKYPRDQPGEELADNARVWLTYLDEAGAYDRDKVEGWKDTVDVLLVFAGLFSGVITTFVSQASQSLQQDYTQVSASLLFQISQVQLAQFTGMPITIPNATLNPSSPFRPSTNASLVNGLWFTSLVISLTTALFAVLTKQWLYFYMSAVPGTALNKVRVRHFRFRGLELWKVALIVDLLPILLHLALGVFLIGIIIFLFQLDSRIAWTIIVISTITYTLYFTSVILPIRYPDCPYTTSLTIYVGNVFHFLSAIIQRLRAVIPYKGGFQDVVSTKRLINWSEEALNKAIQENEAFLDSRSASVHPDPIPEFEQLAFDLSWALELNETNLVDLRYSLCLDLQGRHYRHWFPLLHGPVPSLEGNQLDEYQSYSLVARNVINHDYDQVLEDALRDNLKFPVIMWRYFLDRASVKNTLIAKMLTYKREFNWFFYPGQTPTDVVSFGSEDLGKCAFDYFFRCFCNDGAKPDYSSASGLFKTFYLLLVCMYRNLTSDRPIIIDERQRQKTLEKLFWNFYVWLVCFKPPNVSPGQLLAFHNDILCNDAFWDGPMTDEARRSAALCLDDMCSSVDATSRVLGIEYQDLSFNYRWCSRDLSQDLLRVTTSSVVSPLFMRQNRARLFTILSGDPDAPSRFSKCIENLRRCKDLRIQKQNLCQNLMDLFTSTHPAALSKVLYDSAVLMQFCKFFASTNKPNKKNFLLIVKPKLDQQRLEDFYAAMVQETQSDENADFCGTLDAFARELGRIIGVNTSPNPAQKFGLNEAMTEDVERGSTQELNDKERTRHSSIFYRIKKS